MWAKHIAARQACSQLGSWDLQPQATLLQADRGGRHLELAEAYASSDLAAANAVSMQAAAAGGFYAKGAMPPAMLKELATRSETTTPVWFGFKTLLKVSPCIGAM